MGQKSKPPIDLLINRITLNFVGIKYSVDQIFHVWCKVWRQLLCVSVYFAMTDASEYLLSGTIEYLILEAAQTTWYKMLSFLSWCTCKITVLFVRMKRFIDRSGAYFLAYPVYASNRIYSYVWLGCWLSVSRPVRFFLAVAPSDFLPRQFFWGSNMYMSTCQLIVSQLSSAPPAMATRHRSR